MRERQYTIERILRMRFGEIDPQLEAIIPPLLALSAPEYTPPSCWSYLVKNCWRGLEVVSG